MSPFKSIQYINTIFFKLVSIFKCKIFCYFFDTIFQFRLTQFVYGLLNLIQFCIVNILF